jgi:hypothetical protein
MVFARSAKSQIRIDIETSAQVTEEIVKGENL